MINTGLIEMPGSGWESGIGDGEGWGLKHGLNVGGRGPEAG